MKAKRWIPCVLTPALCWVMACVALAEIALDKPATTSGEGRLYQTHEGGFKIAVLHGNWYEMGRQYGELLAADIVAVHSLASLTLGQTLDADRTETVRNLVRQQVAIYPKRFHDFLRGTADGSGLTMEQIAFVENVVNLFPAMQEGLFCSTLVAWGDYTTDGRLFMARNFDYPAFYLPLSKYLCVTVLNPTDGSVPTATFGYAGQLGCVQAFNQAGLVLEVNVAIGFNTDNAGVQPDRITMPLLLTQLALDSETLEQMEAACRTMRSNFPLLNTIADTKRGCTYEMGTRDVVRRDTDEAGLNTTTNFIGHPSWKSSARGDDRQANIQNFAKRQKGRINRDTLKEGWQTWHSSKMEATLYQFIYEPATKVLSLRLPNESVEWTDVDLPLFFTVPLKP